MAPINKNLKQKITYEDVYPLKHTKSIITTHHHHNNIWKKTLHSVKEKIFDSKTIVNICNFTLHTLSYFCDDKTYKSKDLGVIRYKLEKRILEEKQKQIVSKKEDNSFISAPEQNSAQDFVGLLWSWKVNHAAKKAGKRIEFLQKCIWLTLETMTDIDVHILAQLLKKHRKLIPNLQKHLVNYKETVKYLQEEIFYRKNVIPKVIQALNHWFTIMPLLEEIRQYTGWLYILNIKAFLLDADTLYDILMKVENV